MSINLAWYARTEFLHEGALVEKIVFVEKHALLSLPACHRMCVLFFFFCYSSFDFAHTFDLHFAV